MHGCVPSLDNHLPIPTLLMVARYTMPGSEPAAIDQSMLRPGYVGRSIPVVSMFVAQCYPLDH